MRFDDVVRMAGAMPCFDLALLVQAFDDRRESIRVQLSRWMKQGKVIGLRRGVYTLSDTYRRVPLTPPMLAGRLYRPSYLSGLWALGHYDLIPERVVTFTSVTTRVPRRFDNALGVFDYRNVKQTLFSPQPEGGYTVTSPLLPELVTEGNTIEEVLTNVRDALAAVIETYEDLGRRVPQNALVPDASSAVWFETLVTAP